MSFRSSEQEDPGPESDPTRSIRFTNMDQIALLKESLLTPSNLLDPNLFMKN